MQKFMWPLLAYIGKGLDCHWKQY